VLETRQRADVLIKKVGKEKAPKTTSIPASGTRGWELATPDEGWDKKKKEGKLFKTGRKKEAWTTAVLSDFWIPGVHPEPQKSGRLGERGKKGK